VFINDYKKHIEVQVDPTTLACMSWCPIGSMYPFELVDPNATNLGPVTMPDGRIVQHWQYKDLGPLRIVMETDNSYVDQSDPTYAVPVLENDVLTPFGIHLGVMNESWSNWKNGAQDPSLFAYTNGPEQGCQKSSQCNGDAYMIRRLKEHDYVSFKDTAIARGLLTPDGALAFSKKGLALGSRGVADRAATPRLPVAPAAVPQFPQDFFAYTQDFLCLPQGQWTQFIAADGTGPFTCCGLNSN